MKNILYIIFILLISSGIALPDDEETGLPNGPTSGPPGDNTPTYVVETPTSSDHVNLETSVGTSSDGDSVGSYSRGEPSRGEPEYSVELQKNIENGVNTFFPGDEITVQLKVRNMLKNTLEIVYIDDEIPNTFKIVNAVPSGYNISKSNNTQKIRWDYSWEPYRTTKSNIIFYYTIKSFHCNDYSLPKTTLDTYIIKRNGQRVKISIHSNSINLKIDDEISGHLLTLIPPSPIVIIDKVGKKSIIVTAILKDLNKQNVTYFIRLDNNIRKDPINNSNMNGYIEYMWDLSDLDRGEHTLSLWMTYNGVDHLVKDQIIINIYRISPTRSNQIFQVIFTVLVSAGVGAILARRFKKSRKQENVEFTEESDTSSADKIDVE